MHSAYINRIGKFLPGEAINNHEMEEYLGKIADRPSRVRQRILNSNGIKQRYYAIDKQQQTLYSNSQMAAFAVRDAIAQANLEPGAIDLLACATTLPDLLVPGFASTVHGELSELSPLEIVSTQGVCCAGVTALNYATSQLELGKKQTAIAVASEFPSRLFKNSKFEVETSVQAGKPLPFDTEFLRWMLSDGAGAFLLQNHPNASGISLKIEWIELISHANAYPVCMYSGLANETSTKSWLDYSSYLDAATAGAFDLRQNIRLLDNVMKLGVEGWLGLIKSGRVCPQEIDWLLCHYSSHFFRGQIVELLEQAGCMIPEEKWFTNLYSRGNTGCAAIYLMLEELFNSGKLQSGQKIFCFVPESGRFTTAYMMLTVVENTNKSMTSQSFQSLDVPEASPLESVKPEMFYSPQAYLLRELAWIWLRFDREIRSVPIVRKLYRGEFTIEDYQALLCNLRPQVVEGARWIARAASNMTDFRLRSTFIGHAQDEHRDYQMLERNYVSVGGELSKIVEYDKNIGSEALSAFIFHQASRENPVDLIGSMFIIEGLGNRLAGKWAKEIKETLGLQDEQVSFLAYHGANDESHLAKLENLINAEWMTDDIARRIVKTARVTARLYLLQLEEIR
ncbi:3-oxoacyl-[acyl-carrier-protein] synthase III C-terminal domain-containing protein [Microcoleus sp. PH2017_08_TRC_O_A]|uniref:3-oxoacyl-[acyl-carrier-protein] synthase III C-terminal domain-containing protein n=1 Tax=Microcoleus sp. PH2017_08_TRC_O_A TaxID=2798819 RepID=UPI001D83CFBF|nr:3-oxoacyl-[acyl-carrier-protein] synthase III C-terminal domain-containing protein [Microcoleus sp. PH2017_08_TRC_O_A]MCC3456051.1 iron-containing redox enzyme family protein [Microcoleus sp. PH2017_08_TRC_O_A]